LPEEVQAYLRDGRLSAGHARALITAPDAVTLARSVIEKGLSVRQTEKLAKVKPGDEAEKRTSTPRAKPEKDADTKALESDLSAALSMSVSIDHQPGNEHGALTIRYQSLDDLDRLMALLSA
jgi:ParB family chromosome partitioning protein